MPSPRRIIGDRIPANLRFFLLTTLIAGSVLANAWPVEAQITIITAMDGRRLFVNTELPNTPKFPVKPSSNRSIYLPGETSFTGQDRPSIYLDRDGVEKMVREAAERHSVDPALVRAVIETESNWNPSARSRKGAVGLMQLIPSTAQRFGVNDAFNPKQNVEAGVRYLKTLLERYNGNLDLALAAYNAGEGAVERAGGVPHYRETRNYVQRVQDAYYRPGSGRTEDSYTHFSRIHREVAANGRIIFTNE